jgi:hypothetical protein
LKEARPSKLPLKVLQSLYHYNPVAGTITHLQQRGSRRPGAPAGTTIRGIPAIWAQGRHHKAAAVCWALFHGKDPSPQHVVPRDGDVANLRIANLQLSREPFIRPRIVGRRGRRPAWQKDVYYSIPGQKWIVKHSGRVIGGFESKEEAMAAKRCAMEDSDA